MASKRGKPTARGSSRVKTRGTALPNVSAKVSARVSAKVSAKARSQAVHRVCILTAGGDAPGLNAVLRAFVKTCEGLGIEVFGSEDGFEGLIRAGRLIRMTRDSRAESL
jgi:hypothetical protein